MTLACRVKGGRTPQTGNGCELTLVCSCGHSGHSCMEMIPVKPMQQGKSTVISLIMLVNCLFAWWLQSGTRNFARCDTCHKEWSNCHSWAALSFPWGGRHQNFCTYSELSRWKCCDHSGDWHGHYTAIIVPFSQANEYQTALGGKKMTSSSLFMTWWSHWVKLWIRTLCS